MADDSRTPSPPLTFEMGDAIDARSQDFFQTLRRLECLHRDQPRLGEALRPSQEPVRIGQEASLAFEASTITAMTAGTAISPARLQVSFFGLLGPNGPMPLHLTDYIRQRDRHGHDAAIGRFIDLFHHRLLSLFYRAWANARPTVQHDRPTEDRFALYLGAQLGLGLDQHRNRDAVPDDFKLYMARHFACQSRHPEGLRAIVGSYFGTPVAVEEFVGVRLEIPDAYRWRLGGTGTANGQRLGALGSSTRVGRRVWDRQQKFRIVLGPLERTQYQRLLPGGADLPKLVALVQNYVGHALGWDVKLILRDTDMRPTQLGKAGRLGRTAYLVRPRSTTSKRWQDLVFDPLSRAS